MGNLKPRGAGGRRADATTSSGGSPQQKHIAEVQEVAGGFRARKRGACGFDVGHQAATAGRTDVTSKIGRFFPKTRLGQSEA